MSNDVSRAVEMRSDLYSNGVGDHVDQADPEAALESRLMAQASPPISNIRIYFTIINVMTNYEIMCNGMHENAATASQIWGSVLLCVTDAKDYMSLFVLFIVKILLFKDESILHVCVEGAVLFMCFAMAKIRRCLLSRQEETLQVQRQTSFLCSPRAGKQQQSFASSSVASFLLL